MVGQVLSRRPPLVLRQGPDDGLGNAFSGVGIGNAAGDLGCPEGRLQAQDKYQEFLQEGIEISPRGSSLTIGRRPGRPALSRDGSRPDLGGTSEIATCLLNQSFYGSKKSRINPPLQADPWRGLPAESLEVAVSVQVCLRFQRLPAHSPTPEQVQRRLRRQPEFPREFPAGFREDRRRIRSGSIRRLERGQ